MGEKERLNEKGRVLGNRKKMLELRLGRPKREQRMRWGKETRTKNDRNKYGKGARNNVWKRKGWVVDGQRVSARQTENAGQPART